MCLALYLFAEKELPELAWNEADPRMYTKQVKSQDQAQLAPWKTSSQEAFYIGSRMGCGCGWRPLHPDMEPDDLAGLIRDRQALADMVAALPGVELSLIACWEGDQGNELIGERWIRATDLGNPHLEFEELVRYRIT